MDRKDEIEHYYRQAIKMILGSLKICKRKMLAVPIRGHSHCQYSCTMQYTTHKVAIQNKNSTGQTSLSA